MNAMKDISQVGRELSDEELRLAAGARAKYTTFIGTYIDGQCKTDGTRVDDDGTIMT